MTRRLLAAAALALVASAAPTAQTEPAAAAESAEDADTHLFQVVDGMVYLDGAAVPDAVPPGLDLEGFSMERPLEFSGPIAPILEIDGVAWVLEDRRLVPLEASSRAGQGVYILGGADADEEAVAQMPQERVRPIVEAAYMRDVAERNRALYERMQTEAGMERDVMILAAQVRESPAGAERSRLRERLRELLSDLLAIKHEVRAEEIAVAQARLDAAREGLGLRERNHDEIVEGRLRELVGEE